MLFQLHEKLETESAEKACIKLPESEQERASSYDDFFEVKLSENEDKEKKNLKENDVRTAIDDKVKELPLEELSSEDRVSFQGGKYRTVETQEDIVLYRVYGEGAGKQGRFLTTQKPSDRMNAKIELALPTKIADGNRWTNSRQYFCEVEIPKGTTLNIGKCEKQQTAGGEVLHGGADQVLVSKDFISSNPDRFKEDQPLKNAGNYRVFEKIAKRIEQS